MTHTFVAWPIISALVKACTFLGLGLNSLVPINQTQANFIDKYYANHSQIKKFQKNELLSWASWDCNHLNKILENEGFNIRLNPFKPKIEFGVVSILKIKEEWLKKLNEIIIFSADKKRYKGFYISDKADFAVHKSDVYQNPILQMNTKSGDTVYITISDEELGSFQLQEKIEYLRTALKKSTKESYTEVCIPKVKLDQNVDIRWLLNMEFCGKCPVKAYISQALQQTKFSMDEAGAIVESAVAIGVTRRNINSSPIKKLIIDKPFYLWIEREGLLIPIFSAYIDTDSWIKE